MQNILRAARGALLCALVLSGFGLGLPAAGASASASTPALGTGAPDQPAGLLPATPPGCAAGTPSGANITAQIIPTLGTITSTINISTPDDYLWALSVSTNITHTWPQDLKIHLISPAGSDVVLDDRAGPPGHAYFNFFNGTTWADQAAFANGGQPLTDYPISVAPAAYLNPQEALGVLYGQNPNGAWKLVVTDASPGDGGRLLGWSLNMEVLPVQPPATQQRTITDGSSDTLFDGGTITRSLSATDIGAPLTSITVTTDLQQARPGTLDVYLVSPGGISITLSSNNGSVHPNVFNGTAWGDKAALGQPNRLVTAYSFSDNSLASPLAPEEGLSELLGTSGVGIWRLVVVDTALDGAGGHLGNVALDLRGATCAPDLRASAYPSSGAPPADRPIKLNLSATNYGAGTNNVVMTGTLPADMAFQSIQPYDWSCVAPAVNVAGGTVVCHRPSMAQGIGNSVIVTVLAPLVQDSSLSLVVTSGQADSYPPDNSTQALISTYVRSANNEPWDVRNDDGDVRTGGDSAFNTWGLLRLEVRDLGNSLLANAFPHTFGLAYLPGHRWESTGEATVDTIRVSRSLYAPAGGDWLRYIDTFTNTSASQTRVLTVDWGGALGSYEETATVATSTNDKLLTAADTWAVVIAQQAPGGSADNGVPGFAFRSAADSTYQGPHDFYASPISSAWPASGNTWLGHQFKFNLPPLATVKLAYFVYHGLAEGFEGPQDCQEYFTCVIPDAGAQVALAQSTVAALAANPYFCDLSPTERGQILNWPGIAQHCTLLPAVLK